MNTAEHGLYGSECVDYRKENAEIIKENKLYFDNQKELNACMNKWKERLGLSDWYIVASLVNQIILNGNELAGVSDVQWVNKCGKIELLSKEFMPDDLIMLQPHECTLIHELLHFKFMSVENNSTIESVYYMEMQHQLLEEIARALYMSEYNLTKEWFFK